MKILLAENNRSIIKHIQNLLRKEYVIDLAQSAKETTAQATLIEYRLIIVGLNLPDENGSEAYKFIRKNYVKTPILALVNNATLGTIVTALDSGADSCLSRPFHPTELKARVQALMRRQPFAYVDDLIRIGNLEIDTRQRQVQKDGIIISLRRKEFDILLYLARNRGRIISRNMIINHVWDVQRESWDGTVDVHIMHLRNKIDRPFNDSSIKTAYGIGYIIDDTKNN